MTTDTPRDSSGPRTDAEAVYFAGTDSVDIDKLCERHPQLADKLRGVHERWRRFQSVVSLVPSEELQDIAATGATDGASQEVLGELSSHTPTKSRYQFRGKVAQGGMGAILKVWDAPLKRELAMKVVLGQERDGSTPAVEEGVLSRFLEEALVTGQLDHPGVVPVHELGVDQDGQVFFTMRLVKGRDLKAIFGLVANERDGWSRTRALGTVLRACEALAYAHKKGVIHRDLKPANIMVGLFGEVYVMDWGLAKVRDRPDTRHEQLTVDAPGREHALRTHRGSDNDEEAASPLKTMDGSVIGTPAYMSPEQARGQIAAVDTRSDVYSMGTILYELLTGVAPFSARGERRSPMAILGALLDGPPTPIRELATVPAELEAICEKAMARDPADRYVDVEGLADDLRAYLEHRVVAAYETGAVAELRKWVVRNKALAVSLGAVFVLLLSGGAVFAWLSDQLSEQNIELTELNKDLDVALSDANAQRELADSNASRAEAERANVLRLSAFQELSDLQSEAPELWPATGSLVPVYDAWLARAGDLLAGMRPSTDGRDLGHRARLDQLRGRAMPLTDEQRTADRLAHPDFAEWEQARDAVERTGAGLAAFRNNLGGAEPTAHQAKQIEQIEARLPEARAGVLALEAMLSERQTFHFASNEDTWWHNQLTKLVDELEMFANPETGLLGGLSEEYGWGIQRRRDFAADLERRSLTGPEALARWEEARASIADRASCPEYDGLTISPQLGLAPIGRDANSGLWEFWHLQSGDEPTRDESGKLVLTEESGLVLVLIAGGTFRMGAQRASPDAPNYDPSASPYESPVHEVTLSPYFISKYEMTQGQWERFTGRNPSSFGPALYKPEWNATGEGWSARHPVEQVSWNDAVRNLQFMDLSMPTEAQWENACRAGTTTPYWTGAEPQSLAGAVNVSDAFSASRTDSWAGYDLWLDDGYLMHAPVGSFRANPFGLHDTHGNVWEWIMDGYSEIIYAHGAVTNPMEDPASSIARVVRGGGFEYPSDIARSAFRFSRLPDFYQNYLGVRPSRYVRP